MQYLELSTGKADHPPLQIRVAFKKHASSRSFEDDFCFIKPHLSQLVYSSDIDFYSLDLKEELKEKLPLIRECIDEKGRQSIKISLLTLASEKRSLKDLIFDLCRYHLLPGQTILPSGFHTLNFHFSHAEEIPLFFTHLHFTFEEPEEFDRVWANLPAWKGLLTKGLRSPAYAQEILDFKIPLPDQVASQTHAHLLRVIDRWPHVAKKLLDQVPLFMSLTSQDFKAQRSSRTLAQTIASFAWLKERLAELETLQENHPKVLFRLFPIDVNFSFNKKGKLALCIGVTHLGEYQHLHEGCILQAASHFLPEIKVAHDTYFSYHNRQDGVRLIYLELEKNQGGNFTLEERTILRKGLEKSLEASIEEVVPSLYMMRNEEEIMKNIMTLREEIRSIADHPQVIISLDSYSTTHLSFVVTMVWIAEKAEKALLELMADVEEPWEFSHDLQKRLSQDGEEFTKEAQVFRLRVKKSPEFLRSNAAVNLHQAHQLVVNFLEERLGKIRDYTGGIILLQNALFNQFRDRYQKRLEQHPNLLEDFFYSLHPVDRVITMSFENLSPLCEDMLDLIYPKKAFEENYVVKKREAPGYIYTAIRLKASLADEVDQKIKEEESLKAHLIDTRVNSQGFSYLGYIFCSQDHEERVAFSRHVKITMKTFVKKEESQQAIHLPVDIFPTSLDPRLSMLLQTNQVLKLLFDGLMRVGSEGKLKCAVAKTYDLSEDGKTYTFHLRESYWNNGDPVTAHDFAYSWKKVLSPSFNTPFAYPFFSIINAKEAKLGKCSMDKVGVYAKNDRTLIVELEQPTPHFLHYLTLNTFFPVNQHVDQIHPDWPHHVHKEFPCNGPFILEKASLGKYLRLVKNSSYWDQKSTHLNRIDVSAASLIGAAKQYRENQADWLGFPLTSWDNQFIELTKVKYTIPQVRLCWMVVNTEQYLMHNKKFRQALYFALDRNVLVEHLPLDASSIGGVFPSRYSTLNPANFQGNPKKAKELYYEALRELNVGAEESIRLTLGHCLETFPVRKHMIYEIQRQLKSILGIDLEIRLAPWATLCEKVMRGELDLCFLSWNYFVNTPFYFLDAFHPPENKAPFSWTNPKFLEAVAKIRKEKNPDKQKEGLVEIEKIFYDECPIIPIYSETEHYIKNVRLKEYDIDEKLGLFDFKEAYLKSVTIDTEKIIKWF